MSNTRRVVVLVDLEVPAGMSHEEAEAQVVEVALTLKDKINQLLGWAGDVKLVSDTEHVQ